MHRIDGPGAVNNLFTEGDPSAPQMATVVTAAWLNDVQENIVQAIVAAGITPTKGDSYQLLQAIGLLSGSGLVGEIRLWGSETLPADGNWLETDGSALLKVDYAKLYAVHGDRFGTAPAGYFRLPDIRGIGVRGWDHGRGKDPDAALRTGGDHVGSTQEDAIKQHSHVFTQNLFGDTSGNETFLGQGRYPSTQQNFGTGVNADLNAYETRMKNIALMFIVRWR